MYRFERYAADRTIISEPIKTARVGRGTKVHITVDSLGRNHTLCGQNRRLNNGTRTTGLLRDLSVITCTSCAKRAARLTAPEEAPAPAPVKTPSLPKHTPPPVSPEPYGEEPEPEPSDSERARVFALSGAELRAEDSEASRWEISRRKARRAAKRAARAAQQ